MTVKTISTPSMTVVEMNELVLPQHSNNVGTAFGGVIMSWIDVCAATAAQRHARKACVTASMDQLDFIAGIRLGHVVNLKSIVNDVGRTSMEIGVRVEVEDPFTGVRMHAASAYLTFVAIDADGKPTPVPRLTCETNAERLRQQEAHARRALRLKLASERRRLAEAIAAESDDG